MENATKALLIAAAVLVTILIIYIALWVIRQADVSEGGRELDELKKTTLNNKYETITGIRSGTIVRAALENAIKDNEYLKNENVKRDINIRSNHPDILNAFRNESEMIRALNGNRDFGVRVASNITRIRNVIKTHEKYKLWFSYKDGYIWEIHIDEP